MNLLQWIKAGMYDKELLSVRLVFLYNINLSLHISRDHSDGLWNESQTTVLQVDSGTENGTVIR